jgi:hypothetical protein
VTGIVEFLTARLDADEQVALGVSDGPRRPEEWIARQWPSSPAPRDWAVDCPFGAVVVDGSFRASAEHIARHDPARVLREASAKRRVVELHAPESVGYIDRDGQERNSTDCEVCGSGGVPDSWPCDTLRHLAAVYADHPDYDPAWRVS